MKTTTTFNLEFARENRTYKFGIEAADLQTAKAILGDDLKSITNEIDDSL